MGVALLCIFVVIETAVPYPMFRLQLFRIRAFTFGSLSSFLSALARGGLMFMLIIWLQGIWLPLHGFSFSATPLWAGIYMLPLSIGVVLAGPISGILSDRFGSRPFATGGMIMQAAALRPAPGAADRLRLPRLRGDHLHQRAGPGVFASPNRAGVMNSLPPEHRGSGSGMNTTFQNCAQVLSIGVFFTLMIVGLSAALPQALGRGLLRRRASARRCRPGRPPAAGIGTVRRLPRLQPARSTCWATPCWPHCRHAAVAKLTSESYFPSLISAAFRSGLHEAFTFALICCCVAAVASWSRGTRYVHGLTDVSAPAPSRRPLRRASQ